VSLATVDRVLNNRPGVRVGTAERVREACERLGYSPNLFAARLARGASYRLAFVLPTGANRFMLDLAEQVKRAKDHFASQRAYLDVVHADVFDPKALAAALERLGDTYQGVAVVALDHPRVRRAIDGLTVRGVRVATLVSDVPTSKRLRYVGIDNVAAGRTAGTLLGRFVASRKGPVGVILGSTKLSDHAERLRGFGEVLSRDHRHLQMLPARAGRDDDEASAAVAAALLTEHPDLVALYSIGAGNAGVVHALKATGRAREIVFIGHELSEQARDWLCCGTMDAVINQDAGHEVRSAARVLLADLAGERILPDQERIRIEIFLRDNLP
jgi:LacI family transcriptional regulator